MPSNDLKMDDLVDENRRLLEELETAYKNMEIIYEQSSQEKLIAYKELQLRYEALEQLYGQLNNRENLLIHMEKLSSIGQFITEIIHELNNPLTVICGTGELMQMMGVPDRLTKHVEAISRESHRMTTYLTRFRNMVYKERETFHLFEANENLRDCLSTLEIIKPKQVNINAHYHQKGLRIKGDPYQINQIYLNLAKNAMDAMDKQGGSIDFTTASVQRDWILESGEVGKHYCQDQSTWKKIVESYPDFAMVEVADSGGGIPQNILPDIFQAFLTTKPRGKGTGLGLSISSDIVKRHGGNLAVKSVQGQGTTFQLLIPVS